MCVKNFNSFLLNPLERNLVLIPTGASSVALSLHVNDGLHTDLPVSLLFQASNYFANLETNPWCCVMVATIRIDYANAQKPIGFMHLQRDTIVGNLAGWNIISKARKLSEPIRANIRQIRLLPIHARGCRTIAAPDLPLVILGWNSMLTHKKFRHVVRSRYLAFSDLLQRWPHPFRLTRKSKHGEIRRCPRKATLPPVHRVSRQDH